MFGKVGARQKPNRSNLSKTFKTCFIDHFHAKSDWFCDFLRFSIGSYNHHSGQQKAQIDSLSEQCSRDTARIQALEAQQLNLQNHKPSDKDDGEHACLQGTNEINFKKGWASHL